MDRSQPPTQVYTYADLRRIHTERLQAEQKSTQHIRNHDSALNLFMSAVGKSDISECGQDFAEQFETSLALFTESLTGRGVSAAGIANNISCARAIRLTFNSMLAGTDGPDSFTTAFRALMKAYEPGYRRLGRELGIHKDRLINWVKGDVPRKQSFDDLKKIERYFGLPEGTLVNKIACKPDRIDAPDLKSRKARYALTFDAYMYKNPTEMVRNEWTELLHFRTAPYLVNGLQRNSTWRVKPMEKITRVRVMGWECTTPMGGCMTAHILWRYVARFFGYLLRKKELGGLGMEENQLSLALLSDAPLVLGYAEFRRMRSGVYTQETGRFFGTIGSFLRKDTGFLWQMPKFAERLLTPVPEAEWHSWCEKNRATLLDVVKELQKGGHVQQGRNPQEPIAKILAEQHPIRVLIAMVNAMEKKFLLAQRLSLLATHKRDVLLIKMLISNPLRVHHYCMMTYHKDNTGNLYQDSSGAWRLRFQPVDFKNQRGAASKDYDVQLSPWLYQDIEEYFATHRPILTYAAESDRVFLNNNVGGWSKYGSMSISTISDRITAITREYLPDCPGFGPHAFRHIVATDYIKNNPNGFQVAANILHDRLETVMQEYAHVKVSDGFSHWTSYLGEQVKATGVSDE